MAPRAYWKGYLRLSLVSCPIQLFPATSEREKIRFHQINKKTGNRIKYCKLDAETGEEVEAENIVMGYEVSKERYVEITKDELEAVAIESTHTIEIDQFVPRNEIDDLYLNAPYYITPDGDLPGFGSVASTIPIAATGPEPRHAACGLTEENAVPPSVTAFVGSFVGTKLTQKRLPRNSIS